MNRSVKVLDTTFHANTVENKKKIPFRLDPELSGDPVSQNSLNEHS